MPVVIFLCLVFLLNVSFQKVPLKWWRAVLTALAIAVAGTIVFQIVVYIDLGYVDPFLPIAVPIQIILAIFAGAFASLVKVLIAVSRS
jgi:hypothetical protein